MAKVTLAKVELPSITGLPEDSVTNSFVIYTGEAGWSIGPTTIGDITFPLIDFYNTNGGHGPVAQWLSPSLSRASMACSIKLYDITTHLDGSPHGSPLGEDHFTLADSAWMEPTTAVPVTMLPDEVAVVLTLRSLNWQMAPVEIPDTDDFGDRPDRPKERHTGRLYIGPLATPACQIGAGGVARPAADLRTTLEEQADDLARAWHETAGFVGEWSVWSRKDATVRQITDVQTDDAFDTQRRRGVRATIRSERSMSYIG